MARSAVRPARVLAGSSPTFTTCTSSGNTRCDTPRCSRACFTASTTSSAWSVLAYMVRENTLTSSNAPVRLTSWNAPRPSTFDGT